MGKKEEENRIILSFFGGLICGLNQLVSFSIFIFRVCNDCQRLLIFLIITLLPALTPSNSCHMEHSSSQKNSSDDEKVTSVNDKLGNKENDNWKPTFLLTITWEYGSLASPVVVGSKTETLLRHIAMVAKFLDNHKPKKSLKVHSHYFKLHRSYSNSFNLANLGEIFFGTVSILI